MLLARAAVWWHTSRCQWSAQMNPQHYFGYCGQSSCAPRPLLWVYVQCAYGRRQCNLLLMCVSTPINSVIESLLRGASLQLPVACVRVESFLDVSRRACVLSSEGVTEIPPYSTSLPPQAFTGDRHHLPSPRWDLPFRGFSDNGLTTCSCSYRTICSSTHICIPDPSVTLPYMLTFVPSVSDTPCS